jgi:hypothetical protein
MSWLISFTPVNVVMNPQVVLKGTGVDFFLNHGGGNADAKIRNPLRYL